MHGSEAGRLLRRWGPALGTALLAAWLGAYLAGFAVRTAYLATAIVQVENSAGGLGADQTAGQTGQDQAPTYARLARTTPVLAAALARAGQAGTPAKIVDQVVASMVPDTNLLEIGVYADNPAQGARLANAIAGALIDETEQNRQRAVAGTLAAWQAQIAALGADGGPPETMAALRAAAATYQANIAMNTGRPLLRLAAPAVPPREAIATASGLTAVLVSGVALLLAGATALLLERLDNRVRGADDLRRALDLPLLGTIPKAR